MELLYRILFFECLKAIQFMTFVGIQQCIQAIRKVVCKFPYSCSRLIISKWTPFRINDLTLYTLLLTCREWLLCCINAYDYFMSLYYAIGSASLLPHSSHPYIFGMRIQVKLLRLSVDTITQTKWSLRIVCLSAAIVVNYWPATKTSYAYLIRKCPEGSTLLGKH